MAVTRQEYYNDILRRSLNRYQNLLKQYNKDVETIIEDIMKNNKSTPTFLDYASLVLMPFRSYKSFKNAFMNVAFGGSDVLTNAINDIIEAGKAIGEGDWSEAGSDLLYFFVNPVVSLAEGFAASAATMMNYVQKGIADIIPDNWYSLPEALRVSSVAQESYESFITGLQQNANAIRAGILDWNAEAFKNINGKDAEAAKAQDEINREVIADEMRQIDYSGILPGYFKTAVESFRMQNGSMLPQQDSLSRYTFEDYINDTNYMKPLVKEATGVFYKPTMGKIEQNWQEKFGDMKWFNTVQGTFDSIGDILAMFFVSKVARATGIPPATSYKYGQAFFFGNIAARSFEESLNAGSSIQDAMTYGIGVAATETVIENLGGITFANPFGNFAKAIGKQSLAKALFKNALEEGFEEVVAEFSQSGLEAYKTGEIQNRSTGSLFIEQDEKAPLGFTLGDAVHSFLAGFAASFILGGGQSIVLNRTINSSVDKTIREFSKFAEKYGQAAALDKFKVEVLDMTERLNKNPLGQVINENGEAEIVRMNKDQVKEFINNSVLKLLVTEDANGKFVVDQKILDKFTVDGLQLRLQDGTVVNRGEYAANNAVFGVDITNQGKYNPTKISELNPSAKALYDIANKLKAPIIIYTGEVRPNYLTEQGELAENGALYINQNTVTPENIRAYTARLIKHESIHLIKSTDPQLYASLEKVVTDNITLRLGNKMDANMNWTVEATVVPSDKISGIEPLLVGLQEDLNNNISNVVRNIKEQLGLKEDEALPENIALEVADRMNEELVAYLTERLITDGAFYELFERINPTLVQRLGRIFGQGNKIGVPSKIRQVNRFIKDYAENYRLAVREVQAQRQSLEFFINSVFGNSILAANVFFTQEAIKKYGLTELVKSLVKTFDKTKNSIIIDDEEILLDTISRPNSDWSLLNPQRVAASEMRERVESFVFDKNRVKEYLSFLRSYERTLNQTILTAEGDVFQKTKTRLNVLERLMEKIEDGILDNFGNAEKAVLIEAIDARAEKDKPKTAKLPNRMDTIDRVIFNLNSKAIRQFVELSAFKDWKNNSYTDGAITFTRKVDAKYIAEQLKTMIEFDLENMQTGKGKRLLAGQFDVEFDFNPKTKEVVFFVSPKDEVVREAVKKEEARIIQEQSQQEQAEQQEITPQERKKLEKYYSNETLAKTTFNTVVSVLQEQGINISDLTVIESSAGDGAFIKVFRDFDENIKVEAYDIAPEAEGIQQQDFLKLEKEFDKDSIVIGNPPFSLDSQFINKSLQIAPAVAFILPATWIGSYTKHSTIDPDAVLIFSENLGVETYDAANKQKRVKSVLQIWAKPSLDSRYNVEEDLRITKPNPRSHPDFQTRVLNGSKEVYENAKLSIVGEQLKFAIRMKGLYPDYNQQIVEKFEDLDQNGEYLLVYSARPEVIERIKKIDFEQLAIKGSSIFKGFTLYDFIAEYEKIPPVLKEVEMSKQKDSAGNNLSVAQAEFFKNSKIRDSKGNLSILYHGSTEMEIETFDPDLGGLRQQTYEKFAFFTNEFSTAKEFSAFVNPTNSKFVNIPSGKFGKVYSIYANVTNPLDMRNLSEKDINFLAQSYSETFGETFEDSKKVIQRDIDSHQSLKISFNANQLKAAGYDGFIAEMYPKSGIFEIATVDSKQTKTINNLEPKDTSNIYDGFPRAQRVDSFSATDAVRIGKIFGDNFIAEYFEKTNRGYVIRSSYMRNASGTNNSVTLKYDNGTEKTFAGDEFAINIYKHKSKAIDYIFSKGFEPYRINDLSPEELFYYNLLKSFNINFVAGDTNYGNDKNKPSRTMGFSTGDIQSDVVFIDLRQSISDPSYVFEVLVHEHVHVIFKQNPQALIPVLQVLYDTFFEVNAAGEIVATNGFKEFINGAFKYSNWVTQYLNKQYEHTIYANVFDLNDIGVLFNKVLTGQVDVTDRSYGNYERRAVDEILAQISGKIFSSNAFVKKIFNVELTTTSKNTLSNYFDSFMIKYAGNQLFDSAFSKVFKSFNNAKKAHEEKVNKMFPSQKVTASEINDFINSFSEGKFKNRKQLFGAFVDDQKAGIKGEASIIIQQIIFLAKKLAPTVVSGFNAYQELEKEMQRGLNAIQKLLDNPEDASYLTANQSLKIYNNINKKYGSIIEKFRQEWLDKKHLDPNFNFVNPAESETWLDLVFSTITTFAFEYLEIDPDILSIFDLIDSKDIMRMIGGRVQGTSTGIFLMYDKFKQQFNDYQSGVITREDFIDETMLFFNDLRLVLNLFKPLEKLNPKHPDYKEIKTFAEIARATNSIVENEIKDLRIAFERALKGLRTYIDSNTKQAVSQKNPELTEALDYGQQILELLKTRPMSVSEIQTKILDIVDKLRTLFLKTTRIHERYGEVLSVTGTGKDRIITYDIAQLELDFFEKIYGTLESIFPRIKGNNANLLETRFVGDKRFAGKTLAEIGYKPKSYVTFSQAIKNLLKTFETVYTSVFSNDLLSHQETAVKFVRELKGMSREDIKTLEKVLLNARLNSNAMNAIQTPQDFLRKYALLFKDRGVTFFDEFFKQYKLLNKRRQDILMEFYKDRITFLEENEGIEKFEIEKVELPEGLTYNIDQDIYENEILNLIDRTIAQEKEQLKQYKESLKKFKEEAKDLREQRKNARNANMKAYYATLLADNKNSQANLNTLILGLENLPKRSLRIKEAVLEYAKNNKLEKPTITRGELISLYNSIMREAAMHDEVDVFGQPSIVNPTEHFEIGNVFKIFDSTIAEKDYTKAKGLAQRTSYVVLLPRTKMLELIEKELSTDPRYQVLMDFARMQFDKSYFYYNQIYAARFQVDLPQEVMYMPFRTLNSNFLRNFDLQLRKQVNIAANDSATLETKIGARTPLAIQNISSVVNGVITATSNYSFERFITDFQNLLVTTVDDGGAVSVFQDMLEGHDDGAFYTYFQKMMTRVLGYDFEDEGKVDKIINKVANTTYGAKLALSQLTFIKQFISFFTISLKNKVNLGEFYLYINKEFFTKSENRKWLEDNNSNFFFRTVFQGVPGLSDTITGDTLISRSRFIFDKIGEKANYIANLPNGWADSSIIVAAFSYYVNQVSKENPNMPMDEVRQKANELLEDVLLYGVANTDPGFRSQFSASRAWYNRLFNKFSSENILQISGMITEIALAKGGHKGTQRFRNITAFVASSFAAAIVNALFQAWRGFTDDDDVLYDLAFNEFLISNILGAIPYLGVFINNLAFDLENRELGLEFDIQVPGIQEIYDILDRTFILANDLIKGRDSMRSLVKFLEGTLPLLNIPASNIVKLVESGLRIANLFGNDWIYQFEEMYYSRTASEQLNRALKNNDEKGIDAYVGLKVSNAVVKNEIVRVSLSVEDSKLSLYNTNTFRAKNPVTGKMDEISIPERTKEKYKLLTQRALLRLVRSSGYRRLKDEDKLKAIQRVINYYYNFMKNEVLITVYKELDAKTKKEIDYTSMRRKEMLSVEQVIVNALREY